MSKNDVKRMVVVLGDHNLKKTGETRGVKNLSVRRVIRHKQFDSASLVSKKCTAIAIAMHFV